MRPNSHKTESSSRDRVAECASVFTVLVCFAFFFLPNSRHCMVRFLHLLRGSVSENDASLDALLRFQVWNLVGPSYKYPIRFIFGAKMAIRTGCILSVPDCWSRKNSHGNWRIHQQEEAVQRIFCRGLQIGRAVTDLVCAASASGVNWG